MSGPRRTWSRRDEFGAALLLIVITLLAHVVVGFLRARGTVRGWLSDRLPWRRPI